MAAAVTMVRTCMRLGGGSSGFTGAEARPLCATPSRLLKGQDLPAILVVTGSQLARFDELADALEPQSFAAWVQQLGSESSLAGLEVENSSNVSNVTLRCPEGLAFLPGSRSVSLDECSCSHGWEVTVMGCQKCPAGTYKSSVGDFVCDACPEDRSLTTTIKEGQLSKVACVCQPGTYPSGLVKESIAMCKLCPKNNFCTGGDASSSSCPENTETMGEGAAISRECLRSAGFMNSAGHLAVQIPGVGAVPGELGPCTACPPGWIKASPGEEPCLPCDPGQASNVSTCESCPPGKMSLKASSNCTECSAGEFQDKKQQDRCSLCRDGIVSDDRTKCWPCPKDQTNASDLAKCACEQNFMNQSGACVSCPPGGHCVEGIVNHSLEGFWLLRPGNADTYSIAACPFGKKACADRSHCAASYEGSMCAVCAHGFTRLADACVPCGSESLWLSIIGPGIIIAVLAMLLPGVIPTLSQAMRGPTAKPPKTGNELKHMIKGYLANDPAHLDLQKFEIPLLGLSLSGGTVSKASANAAPAARFAKSGSTVSASLARSSSQLGTPRGSNGPEQAATTTGVGSACCDLVAKIGKVRKASSLFLQEHVFGKFRILTLLFQAVANWRDNFEVKFVGSWSKSAQNYLKDTSHGVSPTIDMFAPIFFWSTYLLYPSFTSKIVRHFPFPGSTFDCLGGEESRLSREDACRLRVDYRVVLADPVYQQVALPCGLVSLIFYIIGIPFIYSAVLFHCRSLLGIPSECDKDMANDRHKNAEAPKVTGVTGKLKSQSLIQEQRVGPVLPCLPCHPERVDKVEEQNASTEQRSLHVDDAEHPGDHQPRSSSWREQLAPAFSSLSSPYRPRFFYFKIFDIIRQLFLSGILLLFDVSGSLYIFVSILVVMLAVLSRGSSSETAVDEQRTQFEASVLGGTVSFVFFALISYFGSPIVGKAVPDQVTRVAWMKMLDCVEPLAEKLERRTKAKMDRDRPRLRWKDVRPILERTGFCWELTWLLSDSRTRHIFCQLALKIAIAELSTPAEPYLPKQGLQWSDVAPLLEQVAIDTLKDALRDPVGFFEGLFATCGTLDLKLAIAQLRDALEDPVSFFDGVFATSGTLALKLAIAKLRKPAEPYLQEQGLQWSDVAPVLEEVATMVMLRDALEDPVGFFDGLFAASDTLALKLAIAQLRTPAEPYLQKQRLQWSDVAPALEVVATIVILQEALQDPVSFFESLFATSGTLALRLAIAHLRKPAEPYLQKQGLQWSDVAPLLEEVAIDTLRDALRDPVGFFECLCLLATSGTLALKLAIAKLRKPAEPYLQEQGLQWSDVAPVLEEVATMVMLRDALEDPVGFFDGLFAASDTLALKLAIAQLRKPAEPYVQKQGLQWSDVVPVLEEVAIEILKEALEVGSSGILRLNAFIKTLINTPRSALEYMYNVAILLIVAEDNSVNMVGVVADKEFRNRSDYSDVSWFEILVTFLEDSRKTSFPETCELMESFPERCGMNTVGRINASIAPGPFNRLINLNAVKVALVYGKTSTPEEMTRCDLALNPRSSGHWHIQWPRMETAIAVLEKCGKLHGDLPSVRYAEQGQSTELEFSARAIRYLMECIHRTSNKGFKLQLLQWAGLQPMMPHVLIQHTRRLDQGAYVLVAVAAQYPMLSITTPSPANQFPRLKFRIGQYASLPTSHIPNETCYSIDIMVRENTCAWKAINVYHLYKGKGGRLQPENHDMLLRYLEVPRPTDASQNEEDQKPLGERSLPKSIDMHSPGSQITMALIKELVMTCGRLFKPFLTIGTLINAESEDSGASRFDVGLMNLISEAFSTPPARDEGEMQVDNDTYEISDDLVEEEEEVVLPGMDTDIDDGGSNHSRLFQIVAFFVNLLPETEPAWWGQASPADDRITWEEYKSTEMWYNQLAKVIAWHGRADAGNKLQEKGTNMAYLALDKFLSASAECLGELLAATSGADNRHPTTFGLAFLPAPSFVHAMAAEKLAFADATSIRPVGKGHSASCTTWSGSVSKRPGQSSSGGSSGPPSLCPPIVIEDPTNWSRRPRCTKSTTSSEFDSDEDRGARDSKYFGNSADAEGHVQWDDTRPNIDVCSLGGLPVRTCYDIVIPYKSSDFKLQDGSWSVHDVTHSASEITDAGGIDASIPMKKYEEDWHSHLLRRMEFYRYWNPPQGADEFVQTGNKSEADPCPDELAWRRHIANTTLPSSFNDHSLSGTISRGEDSNMKPKKVHDEMPRATFTGANTDPGIPDLDDDRSEGILGPDEAGEERCSVTCAGPDHCLLEEDLSRGRLAPPQAEHQSWGTTTVTSASDLAQPVRLPFSMAPGSTLPTFPDSSCLLLQKEETNKKSRAPCARHVRDSIESHLAQILASDLLGRRSLQVDKAGAAKPLQHNAPNAKDAQAAERAMDAGLLATAFEERISQRTGLLNPWSLATALLGAEAKRDLALALTYYLLGAVLMILAPVSIFFLLSWVEDPDAPVGYGILAAAANALAVFGQGATYQVYAIRSKHAGLLSQLAVSGTLYRRALGMNSASLSRFKIGELTMLLSSDVENLGGLWSGLVSLAILPLEIAANICLLWLVVGAATLGALGLAGVSYAASHFGGKAMERCNTERSALSDERLKLLVEVLYGIKVVKANGWVLIYTNEMVDIMGCAVSLLAIMVFGIVPTASRMFTMWVIMASLHGKIFHLPEALREVSTAWSSLRRFAAFFYLADARAHGMLAGLATPGGKVEPEKVSCIDIQDVSFFFPEQSARSALAPGPQVWQEEQLTKVLEDVQISLEAGRFYAVTGVVGSGKTSLLLALLGELRASTEGGHRRADTITLAYVPQDPVVFNASVRENVCFGKTFLADWYKATLIGSRGINISGGQQARVCLARALYSRAEVYLLDDPLAKLDVRVSSHVFENAILGLLGGHTRIMVTNNYSVARQSDAAIVVESGRVSVKEPSAAVTTPFLQGLVETSDARGGSASAQEALLSALKDEEADHDALGASKSQSLLGALPPAGGLGFFMRHLAAGVTSPGYLAIYCVIIVLEVAVAEAGVYMLVLWTEDPYADEHPHGWYGGIYAAFIVAEVVFAQIKFPFLASITQGAWDSLHDALLKSVLNSSLMWLQAVPVGQVLQRFSGTLGRIEDQVFHRTDMVLQEMCFLPVIAITVCVGFPPFVVVVVVIAVVVYLLMRRLGGNLKGARLAENDLRRASLQHYTETLHGLVLVRTFPGASGWFLHRFDELLTARAARQEELAVYDASVLFRLNLTAAVFYGSACFAIVLGRELFDLKPGFAGFIMANACFFFHVLSCFSEQTTGLLEVARERESVQLLLRDIPQEAGAHEPAATTSSALTWPAIVGGVACRRLVVRGLEVRYRPDLPLVLRGLDLEVESAAVEGIKGKGPESSSASLLRPMCSQGLGSRIWTRTAGLGFRFWCFSLIAAHVGALDGEVSGVSATAVATGGYKWSGIAVFEGKLYAAPYWADKLLIYDTGTGQVSGVSTTALATGYNKWRGIAVFEGKVFAAPNSADQLLIYDAGTEQVSGVSTTAVATGGRKWSGIAVFEGKLYAAPDYANQLLIYDAGTGQVSGVSTTALATGGAKWRGIAAFEGKVYAAPFYADQLLIYDTGTGQVSGVSTTAVATGYYKWSGIAVFEGKLYAAPYSADQLLIYDAGTGQVSGVSTTAVATGAYKWSGIAVLGDNIYAAPESAEMILVYGPTTTTSTSTTRTSTSSTRTSTSTSR
ncbi:unnamed protein product, partial [Polarella glacialis]